jgi:hypothetical protein
MAATIYVCTGGCGGRVTEEEYRAGKTTCGAATCAKHEQPFTRMHVCDTCDAEYADDVPHACAQ